MDADRFNNYSSGIYEFTPCGQINHAVIAVGWDVDSTGEILTIRNSWGPTCEENGYMRIRVNQSDKTCSVTSYAYLDMMTAPPPPPCFNLNTAWTFRNSIQLTLEVLHSKLLEPILHFVVLLLR